MVTNRFFSLTLYCLIFLVLAMGKADIVFAQDSSLSNVIEWPNEGETLYAGPSSLLYKVPIKGRVTSDQYSAREITVELIIYQDDDPIKSLISTPDEDGYYEFPVTVNPGGPTEQFEIAFVDCGIACHSSAESDLQPGKLRLQVTASDPSGRKATAERHITIDISGSATVPVHISLDGDEGQPVSQIDVLASTRLYLWRSRFASGRSDATGLAEVQVEALSQSPTAYVFNVPPTIVDGVLYEGVDSVEVILEAGAKSHPPIKLTVTAERGQISGKLSSPADISAAGLPVWAIRLPAGATLQTTTSGDGEFDFNEVLLGQYLVTSDPKILSQKGLVGSADEIDLTEVAQAKLDLLLKPEAGNKLRGQIQDESGDPLPFAWATVEGITSWQAVLPGFDGQFTLTGLPSEEVNVVVSAPGYYGRVKAIEADPSNRSDITLIRQNETTSREWGSGEIIVPAGTDLREQNGNLILDRGWLWGKSGDGEPLTIQVDATEITIDAGFFALEYLPRLSAWFYLLEGTAELASVDPERLMPAESGQMVNLLNDQNLETVPLNPVVIDALEVYRHVDVPLVWQPTLGDQIRDRLAWIGVGTAQVVTFVTYFVLILSLIFVPLLGIYWWLRRRKEQGALKK